MKRKILALILCIMLVLPYTVVNISATETSGNCGPDVTWSYNEQLKVLNIYGSGDMADHDYYTDVEWYEFSKEIKTIFINEGVTSIGNYAFDCQSHYFLINGRIKWVIENNSKEKKRKKGKGALTQMLNSIKHKDNMGIKPGPKRIAKSTGKPDRRQRDNKKTPGNTPSLKPHNHKMGD